MNSQDQFEPKELFHYRNDTNINYEILGCGNTNVMLIHGFGLSTYSWTCIKNDFDLDKFRLIFIDLKGSGFSDKPSESDYSIKEQSNIVLGLLRELEIDTVSFIGHSYGGMVTLYIHYILNSGSEKQPLEIEKTILLDSPAYNDNIPFFVRALKNPILSFIGLKLFSAKHLARRTINSTFYNKKNARKKWLRQYTYFFRLKGNDNSMVQLAEQLIPKNIESVVANYKKIKSPVLILWGDQDELVNINHGVKLHNQLPNSRLEIVEKCGHVPHEEQPSRTFSLINSFLVK